MNPFRPQVESLDDRVVPSVSASIVGTTLVITGDGNANVATVLDNGTGLAGNIRGVIDGHSLVRLTGGQLRTAAIDSIQFLGKGGNDTFNYSLPFGLNAVQNIYADLGSGNDTYNANLGTFNNIGARINQTVSGQGGNDTITSAFSGALGGVINSTFDGGAGSNKINFSTGLDASSVGVINTFVNDRGTDTLTFNLFDPSSAAAENFQLNANNNKVTIYSAVVGAPHFTSTFFNDAHVTVFSA